MSDNTNTQGQGSDAKTQNQSGTTDVAPAEAPAAWSPAKGKPVAVNILLAGPSTKRVAGVCVAVHKDGRIDAEITMPNGAKEKRQGLRAAGETRFGDGYLEP
jgi:hypothetical protein